MTLKELVKINYKNRIILLALAVLAFIVVCIFYPIVVFNNDAFPKSLDISSFSQDDFVSFEPFDSGMRYEEKFEERYKLWQYNNAYFAGNHFYFRLEPKQFLEIDLDYVGILVTNLAAKKEDLYITKSRGQTIGEECQYLYSFKLLDMGDFYVLAKYIYEDRDSTKTTGVLALIDESLKNDIQESLTEPLDKALKYQLDTTLKPSGILAVEQFFIYLLLLFIFILATDVIRYFTSYKNSSVYRKMAKNFLDFSKEEIGIDAELKEIELSDDNRYFLTQMIIVKRPFRSKIMCDTPHKRDWF